ncbi:MAG: hypothetical protein K1X42_05780 [Opitutaceae bacterium]|nr:hypothetical protein [Opitutaceae bacterium]
MTHALTASQKRQVAAITAAAIALYIGFRFLPTGTNLSHMDFAVKGGNSIEFCDPSNPQFIPVVAVRSPVVMTVESTSPPVAGRVVSARIRLVTSTGKTLGPEDMVVAHTAKLHLLIVDPSLADYHHVHPQPTGSPGEWAFSFTPKGGGTYRIFSDFTPLATGRGLYAHVDLEVAGAVLERPSVSPVLPAVVSGKDGWSFELISKDRAIKAGAVAELSLAVSRADGRDITLDTVMDAFAHLVAFDAERGGFAHLHPNETDISKPLTGARPTLSFKVTIPRAGRYVIWAQFSTQGRERLVPFWIDVT